jgi:hypothetical protein
MRVLMDNMDKAKAATGLVITSAWIRTTPQADPVQRLKASRVARYLSIAS